MRLSTAFQALAIPNFRLLWICSIVSVMGVWLHRVAESWLTLEMTGSPFYVGLVGFLSFAPTLVLSPLGGVLGDRYPKRTVIFITQAIMTVTAGILAILAFADMLQYWHLAVMATIHGFVMSVDMPVRQAFMVEVVGKERIHSAVGMNSLAFNLARAIGPALGGALLAGFSPGYCFAYNAVSYGAVLFALVSMSGIVPIRYDSAQKPGAFKDGLRYLIKQKSVIGLLALLTIVSILIYPYINQLPVFAKSILKTGPEGFGWLMSFVGIGAIMGAIFAAMLTQVNTRARFIRYMPFLYIPALLLFSQSTSFTLSAVSLVLCSFGTTATLSMINASIQVLVVDEMRGRVMGTYSSALNGLYPIGVLVAGFFVDNFGAPETFTGYVFIAAVMLTALFAFYRPQWREMLNSDK